MKKTKNKQIYPAINSIGQSGVILNIILGVMWCFTIVGMIWGIPTIIFNRKYIKTGKRKYLAALSGFFSSLVGGFFVLFSNSIEESKIKEEIDRINRSKKNFRK